MIMSKINHKLETHSWEINWLEFFPKTTLHSSYFNKNGFIGFRLSVPHIPIVSYYIDAILTQKHLFNIEFQTNF